MICFSNDEIEVLYHEGSSEYLVITFGPMSVYADGENFWAKKLAQRANISMLGFMARRANWFPRADVEKAYPYIDTILNRFSRRVTYGHSMGAHAALKFNSLFDATCSIAFVPQVSIDPSVVGRDDGFAKFYSAERDRDVTLRSTDVKSPAYVFYDPYYTYDVQQLTWISTIVPGIQTVRVPMTGHQTIRLFLSTSAGRQVIEACLANDLHDVNVFVSEARRRSPIRTAAVIEKCGKRRPYLAMHLFDHYSESFNANASLKLLKKVAWRANSAGDSDAAEYVARKTLKLFPHEPDILRILASVDWKRRQSGDPAIETARLAVVEKHKTAKALAACLKKDGDMDGAERVYLQAFDLVPFDYDVLASLCELANMGGDIRSAIAWARMGVAVAPRNARAHQWLAAMFLKAGDINAAEEPLITALDLDPNDSRALRSMSLFCVKRKDYTAAVEWAKKAVAVDPSNPVVLRTVAEAFMAAGDSVVAAEWYRSATQISLDDNAARDQLPEI